jgi:transposase
MLYTTGMSRKLTIQPHLSVDEMGQRYRPARDPVERSHWPMLWLVVQGHPTAEVAQLTGYRVEWVRMLVWRSHRRGADGRRDERHTHPGRPPLLSLQQQADLDQAMDGPAPDGGLWSSPTVAAWMRDRLGRRVSQQRGWVSLRRLQRRPKVPRPRHAQADPHEQEDFIKKTSGTVSSDPAGLSPGEGCTLGNG